MPWYNYLIAILIGYVFGSFPSGVIYGRLKGVDVRQFGSGRTGGTNVFRSMGPAFGLATGLSDGAKGFLAVLLVRWLFGNEAPASTEAAAALAGAFAVFGHNWSIFLGFKGGAGGGTAAGSLIGLNWLAALISVPIFLLVLGIGRYASVATMSAGFGSLITLTAFYFLGVNDTPAGHIWFGLLASIWIVIALLPNIRRLLAGEEKRIDFKSRRKNDAPEA